MDSRNSFAIEATRKALKASGAKMVLRLQIQQVGPPLNAWMTAHFRTKVKWKYLQYAALLQSLPSRRCDPETSTGSALHPSIIVTPSSISELSKMIPPSILRLSSIPRSVTTSSSKKRSSKCGKTPEPKGGDAAPRKSRVRRKGRSGSRASKLSRTAVPGSGHP